ncbi:hypothetical protein [Pseudoxanthomonas winnipegensis]|uniref:hypothetical protein n=1 Tax=Pseudoxanthomonas winnipegensis TaxID=2480810 RepID=UPI00102DA73F|nr:hypothetical protein [Pseudoxanthomonas winnipegensis]RZZ85670.1 hypothetical protein EA663_11710 [Pseudoxanthomonas winnipegensis]
MSEKSGGITTLEEHIALRAAVSGSLRAYANSLGIDVGYLSRLASGEKDNPSEEVLEKLGLRKIVVYTAINADAVPTPLTLRTKSA